MSGSLLGMQGLGSNGMGMGQSPSIPPGLLQMLLAHAQQQQGGAQGGGMPGAAMMQGGAPQGAPPIMQGPQVNGQSQAPQGGNPHPQMPMPQGQPQQAPGQLSSLTQPGANGAPSPLAGLLAQLKGGQNGVTPQAGVSAAAQQPVSGLPPWLQQMMSQGGNPGTPQGRAF